MKRLNNLRKRTLALAVALLMCLSFLPGQASAATDGLIGQYADGSLSYSLECEKGDPFKRFDMGKYGGYQVPTGDLKLTGRQWTDEGPMMFDAIGFDSFNWNGNTAYIDITSIVVSGGGQTQTYTVGDGSEPTLNVNGVVSVSAQWHQVSTDMHPTEYVTFSFTPTATTGSASVEFRVNFNFRTYNSGPFNGYHAIFQYNVNSTEPFICEHPDVTDGICDDCGACLHDHDGDGYCTVDNCTHPEDCCPKAPVAATYTVIYTDGRGGEAFGNDSHGNLREGAPIPPYANGTPTLPGYKFMGWYPDLAEVSRADANENNEIIITASWEKDVPNAPSAPEREDLYGILKNFVTVGCTADPAHEEKSYSTIGSYSEATVGEVILNANGTYTCDVTLDGATYAQFYNFAPPIGTGVEHTLAAGEEATKTITLVWDADNGKWKGNSFVPVHFDVTCESEVTPPATPNAPTADDVDDIVTGKNNRGAVVVTCQPGEHDPSYFVCNKDNRIQIGAVEGDSTSGYTCDVTFVAEKFAQAYSTLKGVEHTLVADQTDKVVTLVWNTGSASWQLQDANDAPVQFVVECEAQNPGHTHEDNDGDGKCDECGVCLHPHDAETGDCIVEDCDHTGGCCNKGGETPEPPHKHYDDNKDGICDDCGECLHQKNPDGTCIYGDKCDHDDECCPKGETLVEPETYTVTFCANGGTFTGGAHDVVANVAANEMVSAPAEIPTRDGYTFAGWAGFDSSAPVTGNATYFAQWTEIEEQPEYHLSAALAFRNENRQQIGGVFLTEGVLWNDGTADVTDVDFQLTLPATVKLQENSSITIISTGSEKLTQNAIQISDYDEVNGTTLTWHMDKLEKGACVLVSLTAEGVKAGHFVADFYIDSAEYHGESANPNGRSASLIELYVSAEGWVECGDGNHIWGATQGTPSCTGPVLGSHTCTVCEKVENVTIPATDHQWGPVNQVTPPSCTAAGTAERTCNVCGTSEAVAGEAALGHDMHTSTTEATCTDGGSTVDTCSRCGISETTGTTAALGHDWDGGVVTTPATTTSTGVRTYTCHRDSSHVYTEEIPMLTPEEPTPTPDPTPTPTPTPPTTPSLPDFVEPAPAPAPAPAPDENDIPDADVPQGDGTDIQDETTPLAGAIGLNNVDHFAYMIGYGDGTIHPTANITRAEVATIFFRLMNDEFRSENWATENDFSDVALGQWFNNAISTSANAGKLGGYGDGTFRPNNAITRAEFTAIAVRFLSDEIQDTDAGDFADTANHWAAAEIRRAAAAGWINGYSDGTFRPDAYISRAEAATIINRMLGRVPDADHLLDEMTVWSDNSATEWYYAEIQEATNSHAYERDELGVVEMWTTLQAARNWQELEAQWANQAK